MKKLIFLLVITLYSCVPRDTTYDQEPYQRVFIQDEIDFINNGFRKMDRGGYIFNGTFIFVGRFKNKKGEAITHSNDVKQYFQQDCRVQKNAHSDTLYITNIDSTQLWLTGKFYRDEDFESGNFWKLFKQK